MDSSIIHTAIETAAARNRNNVLGVLERLPNEVKLEIVSWIPDVQSILNLALTGPQFYHSISVNQNRIARSLINHNIPPEIQRLAIASHVVSKAPWNIHVNGHPDLNKGLTLPPEYIKSVTAFVEQYRCPKNFTIESHAGDLRLYEVLRCLTLHKAVRYYAKTLATLAMGEIPVSLRFCPEGRPLHWVSYALPREFLLSPHDATWIPTPYEIFGSSPEVTPMVLLRYEKALYVMHLVSILFSWRGNDQTDAMYYTWGAFWYSLSPWEYEQVYCVHKLLQQHIAGVLGKETRTKYSLENDESLIMARFITHYGPQRLWDLEMENAPRAMTRAFARFGEFRHVEFISQGYCSRNFGVPVHLKRISNNFGGGVEYDSCSYYGDLDLGPMRTWYGLQFHPTMMVPRVAGAYNQFFYCFRCLSNAGYALWDGFDGRGSAEPYGIKIINFSANLLVTAAPGVGFMAEGGFRDEECRCANVRQPMPQVLTDGEYCGSTLGTTEAKARELERLQEESS